MTKSRNASDPREAARRNTRMRLEQWAHNPTCEANTISAVRNVRMAEVAKAHGIPPTFGQSPFAIARGQQFERLLFYNDAEKLIAELIGKRVLPEGSAGFIDLRIRINGGTRLNLLDHAIKETRELIEKIALSSKTKRSTLPVLAAGATVRIPKGILLPEAILIIDAMAIRLDTHRPELIVGEIKTYPDRGGYTDAHDLASARAQAGIYVHGLDLVVSELRLNDRIAVSRKGFLTLTRPGSNQPSVRAGEDLHYQAERAKRGFELLERAAAKLGPDLWAIDETDPPHSLVEAIFHADTNYCEACVSFCDLAPRCFELARRNGNPAILGENVRRLLGSISLPRAVALLHGEKPRNDAERDFSRRFEDSDLRGKP
jgi:hypothetical protein